MTHVASIAIDQAGDGYVLTVSIGGVEHRTTSWTTICGALAYSAALIVDEKKRCTDLDRQVELAAGEVS